MMRGRDVALEALIEEKLEVWMGLKLNREKTRVVELREEGASLEFLGYLFRWDRDRHPLFQLKDEPEGERRSSCGLRGIIA